MQYLNRLEVFVLHFKWSCSLELLESTADNPGHLTNSKHDHEMKFLDLIHAQLLHLIFCPYVSHDRYMLGTPVVRFFVHRVLAQLCVQLVCTLATAAPKACLELGEVCCICLHFIETHPCLV